MVVVGQVARLQRSRALEGELDVAAQVDDVGDAELLERLDVGLGEVLEVVRPQQPTGGDLAAVGGRQAADVPHVDDAVELDLGVARPCWTRRCVTRAGPTPATAAGAPTIGEGLGKYEFPRPSTIKTEVLIDALAEAIA